jgi:hypothetical protein
MRNYRRRLARESPRWGYRRIVGELRKLGLRVSATSVRAVLKRREIPPAPRRSGPSRRTFRRARVVVLDARKLTLMDTSGVYVILNAACGARRDGGRVMLVRGSAHVDRVMTLTAASDEVLIVDLDPTEPAKELLDLGRRTCDPPYPDSAPEDVADHAAAREDAHRLRSLLTHSPVARLFGGA